MKIYTLFFLLLITIFTCNDLIAKDRGKEKSLVDFFLPIDVQHPNGLTFEKIWGDDNVLPRDIQNGLEDSKMKNWCYWDGNIISDDNGLFHIYSSRWNQKFMHSVGWKIDSKAIHAVSKNLTGPYIDKGPIYPFWNNGKGANVIGLRTKDGKYAVVTSEITKGEVFIADSPDGPFKLLGEIKINYNGYYHRWARYDELNDGAIAMGALGHMANVMIILRPDNKYMLLGRYCVPMVSQGDILGPYKIMSVPAWTGIKDIPQTKMEDPTIWHSNGLYHIVVNFFGKDISYHLTSEDGFDNWKYRGIAFSKDKNIFRHQDGSLEKWNIVQRPTVCVINDSIKAFNFSVIDVHKSKDNGNDNHGSKIIVVPFNFKSFSKDLEKKIKAENKKIYSTRLPMIWEKIHIGGKMQGDKVGFDKVVNTINVITKGDIYKGNSDNFSYIYKTADDNFIIKTKILSFNVCNSQMNCGLMFRSSLSPYSPFILASMSKDKYLRIFLRKKINSEAKVIFKKQLDTPYWMMIKSYNNRLYFYISTSNTLNWELIYQINKTEIKNNSNKYYIGMATTSSDNNSTYARFKESDYHKYGNPMSDGIIRHTIPDTIKNNNILKYQIEMEMNPNNVLDASIVFENIKTKKRIQIIRKRFWKSGVLDIACDTHNLFKKNEEYWCIIKAIPMHLHESLSTQSFIKRVYIK